VSVDGFGDFEVEPLEVTSIGEYVRIVSRAHGTREVSLLDSAAYDGIIRDRVLVFEWVDSDVDTVYVRYRVMSDQEYRKISGQ
jgi:hypothetical protein